MSSQACTRRSGGGLAARAGARAVPGLCSCRRFGSREEHGEPSERLRAKHGSWKGLLCSASEGGCWQAAAGRSKENCNEPKEGEGATSSATARASRSQ